MVNSMINIGKLEKLSCLKLDEKIKADILKSIEGVIDMIKEIEQLDIPDIKIGAPEKTEFSGEYNETLYSREYKVSGTHLENKMFLSPKTIK